MRTKIVYGPKGRKLFFINDVEVTAEEYAATVHPWKIEDLLATRLPPGGTATSGWPKDCVALAVQPSQVAEANARNKRKGIHTRYKPCGTANVPDAADYKRLQKEEKVFNKDDFI